MDREYSDMIFHQEEKIKEKPGQEGKEACEYDMPVWNRHLVGLGQSVTLTPGRTTRQACCPGGHANAMPRNSTARACSSNMHAVQHVAGRERPPSTHVAAALPACTITPSNGERKCWSDTPIPSHSLVKEKLQMDRWNGTSLA